VSQDRLRPVQPLKTGTADEQFEELRQHFHERLRKEQRQLATLTKALAGAEGTPASLFSDIREFAHRLRGAALVFGFQGLGAGAKAVELAAIAASLEANSQRSDPSVVSSMRALAINLADQIGSAAP
jgi:HPt (histidine-containing phosphotransfer) domain-containing protein